jgi:N-acetylglucosamine malate deacetylase 2
MPSATEVPVFTAGISSTNRKSEARRLVLVLVLVLDMLAWARKESEPRGDFVPPLWWRDVCVLELDSLKVTTWVCDVRDESSLRSKGVLGPGHSSPALKQGYEHGLHLPKNNSAILLNFLPSHAIDSGTRNDLLEAMAERSKKIIEQICQIQCRSCRVVVFAPHPDDEIIGAFSLLSGTDVDRFLVYVTDGAPLKLGKACAKLKYERQKESEKVCALLGIEPDHVFRLGIPDQETTFQLPSLTRRIDGVLRELNAQVVLLPAYEGGHPDHDSTAFAVHQIASMLGASAPRLLEMSLYHGSEGRMITGEFLEQLASPEPLLVILSEEDRRLKQEAFATYRSQQAVLRCFSTQSERFRLAPSYNFRAPPHPGTLFYERFDWNVTGHQWRQLASQVLTESHWVVQVCGY